MQAEQIMSPIAAQEDLGLDTELDLAEMEIASGRLGDARLRFPRISREQREAPRALVLRARATNTDESRRMLVSFIRKGLETAADPLSRAQLAEALAWCGDRQSAMKALPAVSQTHTPVEHAARQAAVDALGTVPDLQEENPHLTLMQLLQRKLIRRTQN